MNEAYDVIVVGAGPGGYVAAIRAGQLGLRTAVVERGEVGGVCLNWGCIPSKALLRNAEVVHLLHRGEEFGFAFDNLRLDFGKAIDRSRQVVQRLVKGVEFLLRKNKVDLVKGQGTFRDPLTVEVEPTGRVLRGRSVVIATGARARALPVLPVDGKLVITSREALELKQLPESCVIVGGGATGCEFAYLYNAYGVKVTLVELLPHLLPNEDEEVSRELERAFKTQGITVLTGTEVTGFQKGEGRGRLTVKGAEGEQTLEAGLVLVAVGVVPNSDGIGLERAGVEVQRGWVGVDDYARTNVPNVYAIGDVTGKMLLAHVAMHQGVVAVEQVAGQEVKPLEYTAMPRAVYCHPQVTSLGLTEAQAREQGYEVKVGKFPFVANGKALALGERDGFVKVVADARYGELLGLHMVGPEVTELLAEGGLARLLEATTEELGFLVVSHPTLSEALKEAALAALGEAIHI